MGNEQLEDGEFEPMFDDVEPKLGEKPVVIFGSYEWNDGQWMYDWQERCKDNGLNLVADGLAAYDDPDDEALENVADFDGFAFGCPAMGNEQLEDGEFEPMFDDVEPKLGEKPVVIFGSYEWNDGQWMYDWQERCKDNGLNLVADGLAAYDDPDDEALENVKALAKTLVEKL